jgi:hypothetical protein
LPAAPLSVGVVLLVDEPAAGVVSVTAGATQSLAVVNAEPPFCALAVNTACDPVAAATAARRAANTTSVRFTRGEPPARCLATARPAR